ncbi:ROK family transcriptional regulator [Vagococcus sp.]|uniref:ROK family transcriptional regulator n=1 Tax=Vagococcus sp. TaxID=1933889 RepID=UPI003F98FEC0
MIIDKYKIRKRNTAIILKHIITSKSISRSDLALITGLNKASVSDITKELLDQQLIMTNETGEGSQQGGRKPILLTLNPIAAQSISIDLAPKYVEGMLCHLDGTIIKEVKLRNLIVSRENVFDYTLNVIEQLIEDLPKASIYGVIGVSFAVHGVCSDETILYTPNYDLPENFLAQVQAILPYKNITMDNEGNLAALGEYTFGNHSQSLVSINIDTGIGAGLVEKGKLRNGIHGFSGEIGHTILIPDGLICPCGNHGCLERYASHHALYKQLNLEKFNSDELVKRFNSDQDNVLKALKDNAKYLSIAINNFVMIYDPEVIVINSSVYNKFPFLFDEINQHLNNHFANDIQVCNSSLNKKATLLGGISKNIQAFLNVQNLKLDQLKKEIN